MKNGIYAALIVAPMMLAGCVTSQYSEPELSGLRPTGAFPKPNDVCVSLATNDPSENAAETSMNFIACPNHERGAINDRLDEGFEVSGDQGAWTLLQRMADGSSPTSMSGVDHLTNQTLVFFDEAHGTQVAYLAEDGSEWLWYPTNRSALLGYWKIEKKNGVSQICFRYPNSGINPVTGVSGPKWECSLLATYDTRILATTDGDVFNLSSGKIPFVMEPRKAYSFDEVPQ